MKKQAIIVPGTQQQVENEINVIDEKGLIHNINEDGLYVRLKDSFAGISGIVDFQAELVKQEHVQKIVINELATYSLEKNLLISTDFSSLKEKELTPPLLKTFSEEVTANEENDAHIKMKLFDYFTEKETGAFYDMYFDVSLLEGTANKITVTCYDDTGEESQLVDTEFDTYSFDVVDSVAKCKIHVIVPMKVSGAKNTIVRIYAGEKGNTQGNKIKVSNFVCKTFNRQQIDNSVQSTYTGFINGGLNGVYEDKKLGKYISLQNAKVAHFAETTLKNNQLELMPKEIKDGAELTLSFWMRSNDTLDYSQCHSECDGKYIYFGSNDEIFHNKETDTIDFQITTFSGESNHTVNYEKISCDKHRLLDRAWHHVVVCTKTSSLTKAKRKVYIDNVLLKEIEYDNYLLLINNFMFGVGKGIVSDVLQFDISNIKIFNKYLESNEVEYLYEVPQFPKIRKLSQFEDSITQDSLTEINDKIASNKNLINENLRLIQELKTSQQTTDSSISVIQTKIDENIRNIASNLAKINEFSSKFNDEYKQEIENKIKANTTLINDFKASVTDALNQLQQGGGSGGGSSTGNMSTIIDQDDPSKRVRITARGLIFEENIGDAWQKRADFSVDFNQNLLISNTKDVPSFGFTLEDGQILYHLTENLLDTNGTNAANISGDGEFVPSGLEDPKTCFDGLLTIPLEDGEEILICNNGSLLMLGDNTLISLGETIEQVDNSELSSFEQRIRTQGTSWGLTEQQASTLPVTYKLVK